MRGDLRGHPRRGSGIDLARQDQDGNLRAHRPAIPGRQLRRGPLPANLHDVFDHLGPEERALRLSGDLLLADQGDVLRADHRQEHGEAELRGARDLFARRDGPEDRSEVSRVGALDHGRDLVRQS